MSLFSNSLDLDDEVKSLSTEIAGAYVERAQLCVQFLNARPPVSVDELAALWVETAAQINSSTDPLNDPDQSFEMLARVSFDAFCQSYLENVLRSDLKLSLDSEQIQTLAGPTFEAMNAQRVERLRKLTADIATNSSRLAKATLFMKQCLKKGETSGALKLALSAVWQRSELNQVEKQMAEKWLSENAKAWGRPG